jgi:hypothetical protein
MIESKHCQQQLVRRAGHGSSEPVTVQFASAPGADSAELVITGNDPKHPSVSVKLTSTGVADTLSVRTRLVFLKLKPRALNTPVDEKLTIKKRGLRRSARRGGRDYWPLRSDGGHRRFYAPDHLQTWLVTIKFTPVVKGPATGTLTITSDDPKHPNINVDLKGTGE